MSLNVTSSITAHFILYPDGPFFSIGACSTFALAYKGQGSTTKHIITSSLFVSMSLQQYTLVGILQGSGSVFSGSHRRDIKHSGFSSTGPRCGGRSSPQLPKSHKRFFLQVCSRCQVCSKGLNLKVVTRLLGSLRQRPAS